MSDLGKADLDKLGKINIEIVYMDGTLRLIKAPPGTRVEIRDYESRLCMGIHCGAVMRDEQHEVYEEHILERKGS